MTESVNEVKEALKGTDSAAIKTTSERLNKARQTVSAELYRAASERARVDHGSAGGQTGAPPGAGGAPEGSKKEEGPIIDAEVVAEKQAA